MKRSEPTSVFKVNMPFSIRSEFTPATTGTRYFYGLVIFHAPDSVIMSLTNVLFILSDLIVIFLGSLISGKALNYNHSKGNLNQ